MSSITWAGSRYVQELATILGPQSRTQGRCGLYCTCSYIFSKNFEEKPSSFSLDILENSNITAFCPPPVQGGCSVWYNGLYLPSVGNNTTFRMFTPHKSWPSSAA